jgi:hypothetical protein
MASNIQYQPVSNNKTATALKTNTENISMQAPQSELKVADKTIIDPRIDDAIKKMREFQENFQKKQAEALKKRFKDMIEPMYGYKCNTANLQYAKMSTVEKINGIAGGAVNNTNFQLLL